MWSKWQQQIVSSGDAARERIANALEQTGDILTERASAHVAASTKSEAEEEAFLEMEGNASTPLSLSSPSNKSSEKKNDVRKESVVQVQGKEKESIWNALFNASAVTTEKIQKQFEEIISTQPHKRKLSLPLDVDALKDADVVYITNRLISMSHPAMQSSSDGNITAHRKAAAVGHLLEKRHAGKFMVWNLSEVEYDYSLFGDQVLSFKFPGSPAPPLGLMLKLLLSIESWLKADDGNVAVVHCLTGRGRTATILAALLCWTGEAGFNDPSSALEYIARCKRMDGDTLTIPSQRRYAMYFSNMFEGVRPNQPPLLLKRVILSEAPKFGKPPNLTPEQEGTDSSLGCSPYLQIFKAGHLVFTTTATTSLADQSDINIPFCSSTDGPIGFPADVIVQGDILLRCRHLTKKGQRVSMFRAAFHTGYLPPKVLRLPKAQLDGACTDKRFPDDFFVDLIFEACDASMASKHLLQEQALSASNPAKPAATERSNEAADRRLRGTVTASAKKVEDPSLTSSAYTYDSMLHRDSRFWEVVSQRRQENYDKTPSSASASDPLHGPTVGTRREFSSPSGDPDESQETTQAKQQPAKNPQNHPNAFSIGHSATDAMAFMDFFLNEKGEEPSIQTPVQIPAASPKRDELMDALNAIDDDIASPPTTAIKEDYQSEEEIVFDDGSSPPSSVPPLTNSDTDVPSSDSQQSKQKAQPELSVYNSQMDDLEEPELDEDIDFDLELNEEDDDDDDDDDELQDLEDFLKKGGK